MLTVKVAPTMLLKTKEGKTTHWHPTHDVYENNRDRYIYAAPKTGRMGNTARFATIL
jgi:hypothetical protein